MDKLITNLDTNLGPVLREQLDTNFQKIQNGVDGQADSLNKQIETMLGDVPLQDKNEVTQARIDDNNVVYSTLKGRLDVDQTTAETALKEERMTGIEVKAARSNTSGKNYDNLKARLDDTEANLTNNMNAKIAQISSVPETFTDLVALKSAYPNGRTGLFVTADNGHKYIWSNSAWKDAGVYQSVGISDNSIEGNMLKYNTSIGMVFPSGDKPLNFDTSSHTLSIPTPTNIVVKGSIQYTVEPQLVSLINSSGNNHYIVYNVATKNVEIFEGALIDDTKILIGGIRDLMCYINGPYTIDGFHPYGTSRQAYYSIYSNGSGITVDKTNKIINLNGLFFNYGSLNIPLSNKSITYNTDGPLFVYYNTVSKEIQIEMPPINTTSDRVFLGWIRPFNATYSLNISEKQIEFTPALPGSEFMNSLPNIIAFGDSITAGYVPNASLNGGWPRILSKNANVTVYNEGVSSATIQNGSANDSISFVNRSATIDFSRANDVVVFGGTNDFAQNLPIGNISDNTSNSLYGAMNIIFSKIYASNPNAKVYIVLPMWRARITGGNVDVETTPNSIGLLLKDYCEALKNVANKYNVPYLDAYHNMGINSINSKNWLSDGLHPNDIGYAHLARLIGNFVKINQ